MATKQNHIWVGLFAKSLEGYFEEIYPEDDDEIPISKFAEEQGQLYYDHDFVELSFLKKPTGLRKLIDGHSYSDQYIDAVIEAAAKVGFESANVFVMGDSEEFEAPRSVEGEDYQLTYLGVFEYTP